MDLNGDGRLDILTGSISGKIHYFRRKPNGTYAAGETLRQGLFTPLNPGRSSVAVAMDWDGDGDLDLIVGNGEGAVFEVPNTGTRQKPAWGEPIPIGAEGRSIRAEGGTAAPFVADWDGDGAPDLLLGSGSGKVVWYRNQGNKPKPTLAAAATLVEVSASGTRNPLAPAENPTRSGGNSKVCVADWNGDGRPDLIVGDLAVARTGDLLRPHGWVWVYLRQGNGTSAGSR